MRSPFKRYSRRRFKLPTYARLLLAGLLGVWISLMGPVWSQTVHHGSVDDATVYDRSEPLPKTAMEWVDAGRESYAAQDFTEAITLWTQALHHFILQQDAPHQAMVLTYLSLAHQHLGQWAQAQHTIQQSLDVLTESPTDERLSEHTDQRSGQRSDHRLMTTRSPFLLAQALNAQGRLHLALGQAQRAATAWKQGAALYKELGDHEGWVGSRINQVEAIATLGQYRQACHLLVKTFDGTTQCDVATKQDVEALLDTVTHMPTPTLQLLGLKTLGNMLRLVGEVERSRQVLQQGWDILETVIQDSHRDGERPPPSTPWPIAHLGAMQQSLLLSLGETEKAAFKQELDVLNRTFQPHQDYTQAAQQVRTKAAAALNYYRQVAQVPTWETASDAGPKASTSIATTGLSHLIQRQAQAQQLQLLLDMRDWLLTHDQDVTTETGTIESLSADLRPSPSPSPSSLPPSHLGVYAQLNIAQSLMRVEPPDRDDGGGNPLGQRWKAAAIALTQQSIDDATTIQDHRAQSYSLGVMGTVYEQQQRWALAQDYTQQALVLGQSRKADDLAYQWQWQLGRIARAQGHQDAAIEHYTRAFETLQSIRHDLVFLNPDVQFSFQDTLDPVYRQLVDLLLQPNAPDEWLQQARVVMDALQVAEVENFLGQACTDAELAVIDQVVDQADQSAAFIYTIALEDRLGVILKLPQRDRLLVHSVAISRQQLAEKTAALYGWLQQKLESRAINARPHAQDLYDWLVAPFAETLETQGIQTLVFVLDGPLQMIPMSALMNGDRYLIESYAVATTPGLQLVNPSPLEPDALEALVAGWITPPPDSPLSALPGVADEVAAIQHILDHTTVLLNEAFTHEALDTQINRRAAPIVHLATHGQFSSQSDHTFIAMGDGDHLILDQLGALLQSRDQTRPHPIQLLFLSACQTLTGDKRATLGMAGLAIRSGARSTIASLWQADDEATPKLVEAFYQALTSDRSSINASSTQTSSLISRAEALRQAQLTLLHNPRLELPVYWSSFVLLGDWL